MKKNKGITLIALIITIIILLILAGISISSLTESGLFQKAQDATRISEIKEIEEAARLAYMERQVNEIDGGKKATIGGVISDLREKGYKIKQTTGEANTITGIALSEENVTVERNTEKIVTYTLIYSDDTTVRYFVEVQGKDYEIVFNNGDITVNTKETNVGELSKEPEVIVTSSDNTIIEANKTEEGKIVLTAKNELGDVEITIKETNSNVTKTFSATTIISATGLTISQKEATIEVEKTLNLTATIEPSNTTDEIIWSSSNESIATVTQDGTVTGIKEGEVIIIVSCGNKSDVCKVTVIIPPPTIGTNHTAKDISSYSWEELSKVAEVISNNSDIVTNDTEEVSVKVNGKTYTIGVGDTTKVGSWEVRILGFNHDLLSKSNSYGDGIEHTYAGISFEFQNAISINRLSDNKEHNSTWVNWSQVDARKILNTTWYNNINSKINCVKSVKKEFSVTNGGTEIDTVDDYVWFLSCSEIWTDGYYDTGAGYSKAIDGKQYKLYKMHVTSYASSCSILEKNYGTGLCHWYTRSAQGYGRIFNLCCCRKSRILNEYRWYSI